MINLFEKGPAFVMGNCENAAEFVCSDWPEGCGFGSSDRGAVFRSALRDTIGCENAENFFKGKLLNFITHFRLLLSASPSTLKNLLRAINTSSLVDS